MHLKLTRTFIESTEIKDDADEKYKPQKGSEINRKLLLYRSWKKLYGKMKTENE